MYGADSGKCLIIKLLYYLMYYMYTTAHIMLQGTPSITSITFDNADTLTCTSSGGPATSVKWRRNCLLLQSSDTNFIPSQTVTTTGSATYDNSLKLPSTDNDGVYTCSVSNIRGYSIDLIGVGGELLTGSLTMCCHTQYFCTS